MNIIPKYTICIQYTIKILTGICKLLLTKASMVKPKGISNSNQRGYINSNVRHKEEELYISQTLSREFSLHIQILIITIIMRKSNINEIIILLRPDTLHKVVLKQK